jgi:hypothetical protein
MRYIDQSCANKTYLELSPDPLLLVCIIYVEGRFVVVPQFSWPHSPYVCDNVRVIVPTHKPQDVVGLA